LINYWQGLNPVLDHPVVREIAQRLGRSEAQVALRWALQHGQVMRSAAL
jgi:diketogulonate reductase-like aldo/keto reductase